MINQFNLDKISKMRFNVWNM